MRAQHKRMVQNVAHHTSPPADCLVILGGEGGGEGGQIGLHRISADSPTRPQIHPPGGGGGGSQSLACCQPCP